MGDTGIQVGVGVPGGQQLITLTVDRRYCRRTELRALNLDIANRFNSLDRVALIKDLINNQAISYILYAALTL